MKKSGLADSPFFKVTPAKLEVSPPPAPSELKNVASKKDNAKSEKPKTHDTMIPSNRDTMTPRYHDTIISMVRKAVKEFGKEAATHRFTLSEKKAIADIIYTYKSNGFRTSENEVARIAVNFLIEDFRQNGENSILDRVLKALRE